MHLCCQGSLVKQFKLEPILLEIARRLGMDGGAGGPCNVQYLLEDLGGEKLGNVLQQPA